MQTFTQLSHEIMEIYGEAERAFSSFQKSTGLTCSPGCGACCLNKEVSASPLEMLPTALDLFDQGKALMMLEQLEFMEGEGSCIFYVKKSEDGKKGYCSNYQHRPSICRSFGAGATRNKEGKKALSICKMIKEREGTNCTLPDLSNAPVFGEFARRVANLEGRFDARLRPINTALKEALVKILFYNTYLASDQQVNPTKGAPFVDGSSI